MNKKIRAIGFGLLVAVWAVWTGLSWFGPAQQLSESERRPLAQMPQLQTESVLNGTFMTDFEEFTLDQFPLRDPFRRLKSLFHFYVLQQKDNNDIYIAQDFAAKLEYPLNEDSVQHALDRFQSIYQRYLEQTNCNIYMAIAPDKSYYLAQEHGFPQMDYEALFSMVEEGMPWATHVDLTAHLSQDDYYYTDTHWRQEQLLPAAQALSEALSVTAPKAEDFTKTQLDRPFYGVYYGQAALPMEPETMYVMESDLLNDCTVYSYEDNSTTAVYNMDMLDSKDLYDVFLSGSRSLLRIDNPNGATDRELIVFRDSFGSSIVPLLVQDYKTVTVVDIRYLNSQLLGNYVEFEEQDVLFLYSTLVLNNSAAIK